VTDDVTAARDLNLLLAEVERNPENAQSVLQLAQTYISLGDFGNARKWYERLAEIGGSDEVVFHAMYQIAYSMSRLGAPWPDVQDAFLRAWEFRPIRAESLYALAVGYRNDKRHWLAYQFAKLAAEIPFPENELQFVNPDIYTFGATEEQAINAGMIGKPAEAFTLFRSLLAQPGVPDDHRQRIAGNRDICTPAALTEASVYPQALVRRLVAGLHNAEVVVSLVAGPDRTSTEQTLNSFLQCCTDVTRVGRFLAIDAGLSRRDRSVLRERYAFLEFAPPGPGNGPDAQLGHIRAQIDGRFWLHLGHGWEFFAPDDLITRLTAVLDTETQVFQVGINFADAAKLTRACAPEQSVRRSPDTGRYVLSEQVAYGPAMFDLTRWDQAGGVDDTDADPIAELGRRAAAAGLRTATLDEVLCKTAIQRVRQHAQPVQVKDPQPAPGMSKEMTAGNDGPIFIGGAARSGTTLMRLILDSHPRICCGTELKALPTIADMYLSFTGELRPIMRSYSNTTSDVQDQFRAFIEGLVENFRRAEGKPRWAEKTPHNVRCMVPLGEIFPEARFIHMVRDGRDVACSLVTKDWPDPQTGRKLEIVDTMTGAARYWRNFVMAGRRQAEDPRLTGRVLEVRYEALATDTAATMRQVLAFLGEEWDDAVLSHHTKERPGELVEASTLQGLQPVNQAALGRWEHDMTPEDKAAFKAEAGSLLTALGYAPADW
jgi:hypothetical protein